MWEYATSGMELAEAPLPDPSPADKAPKGSLCTQPKTFLLCMASERVYKGGGIFSEG
jgi:hypothetical protein